MLPGINKIPLRVNPAQWQFVMLRSKNKYAIFSRGTGKSWIVGYEVDENVRLMPRGVTTVTQSKDRRLCGVQDTASRMVSPIRAYHAV